jgi:uncharacterized protein YfaS (alpha-2-macroglobulin family)
MCSAPAQSPILPPGVDVTKETVIYGVVSVTAAGNAAPVPGAYVRLLDSTGEFTAEVVTSATGDFRFFAAPGEWTLSVLHKDGSARRAVSAPQPGLVEASLSLE